MEQLELVAIGLTAIAIILLLIRRQRAAYSKHVDQLQPTKKKYSKKVKEFNIYTKEEVAKHNKHDDAWIIVQDARSKVWKVYDITDYIDEHPGGDSILKNVGRDATEGFYGPQHPETVFVMVEEYLIGKLAEGEAQ
uniref:Cytochrome b5 heme-binding domain-containing protein n=1 Tax=Chlamydomonas leiostraca TaxID=1034604 RepID=A0A7S0RTG4_9CHLO|eukprot:CAMPEP_0202868922 /NCGR_PEP_ID=MMETSP1391-20130828/11401_1 /ASSEMBLY_ACC=CAM_ASM_000867 /TAXON_ID=1034604 /ORGANISM="Chlamydomonas leiostraca, Strain SAG 11-49" /LENGTH=135 /DNA_ID=CAMNT_0049549151 /DNA_START=27 /DNA_END=434 /DNA_ORIENTATION=-